MNDGSPSFSRIADPKLLWLHERTLDMAPLILAGVFAERAAARAAGVALRGRLEAMPAEEVILIDLLPLQRADFFALREWILALKLPCGAGRVNRYPIFAVDPSHPELIETLEMIARDRGIILPTINAAGEWRPIGKMTGAERNTLAAVLATEKTTAAELAARLGIPISAASNRLRRLHALCLIRREERSISRGGREFLYRS